MIGRPVAIVTGAARGLGQSVAMRLHEDGYTVVGCGRSAPGTPVPFEHVQLDIRDEGRVREFVGAVAERHGRLDVLVNNAAVGSAALVLLTPGDSIRDVIGTNLVGAIVMSRECARVMARQRSGRVVSISSIAVPLAMEGTAVYSASKAGLEQFMRVLAKELAPLGITCNVIAPSVVETDMKRALGERTTSATIDRLTIQRPASVEDVTNALLFFLRPESSYVTGQVMYLGLSA